MFLSDNTIIVTLIVFIYNYLWKIFYSIFPFWRFFSLKFTQKTPIYISERRKVKNELSSIHIKYRHCGRLPVVVLFYCIIYVNIMRINDKMMKESKALLKNVILGNRYEKKI